MDKDIRELMQIRVISENKILSELIEDIIPEKENKKSNLNFIKNTENENAKKQEFRIVVYKRENPVIKFFKEIKYAFKKLKAVDNAKEINLAQNNNSNN